ncbi:uncharacterized protein TNCV_3555581 [Trichonephila clavipes]|nr:uncharacterized protein TNCV_3555581 [Trichonephila clavipes]
MGLVILSRNKAMRFVPSNLSSFQFCVSCFILLCLTKLATSEGCSYVNDCMCVFPNGSIIDLTSLGYHNQPRWKDIEPTKKDNYTYSYNPCFGFSLGKGACQDVNVCQASKMDGQHFNCGKKVGFSGSGEKGLTYAIYDGDSGRKTNVTLECSPEDSVPLLNVIGEISSKYVMTLKSRCACADLCRESHLSAGSVLVIFLMIGVSLYLVLGIIHSSLTRGAHGWELIPHHEFWADFPLLVRDGCVFVISGCKPETAYERI